MLYSLILTDKKGSLVSTRQGISYEEVLEVLSSWNSERCYRGKYNVIVLVDGSFKEQINL